MARNLNIPIMDITVKSGFSILRPSWDIVMGVKNGRITEEEYDREYMAQMRESWNQDRAKWMDLLKTEEPIALACYCAPGKHCHRHLAVKILEALCKSQQIPFRYYGELS